MVHENTLRRALLFAACALVFFFAWHAKTAGYSHHGIAKALPSTAAKLWLNGQKTEIPAANSSAAPVLWAAILCIFCLQLRRERRLCLAYTTPPPDPRSQRRLYRFLRPPPGQARILSR